MQRISRLQGSGKADEQESPRKDRREDFPPIPAIYSNGAGDSSATLRSPIEPLLEFKREEAGEEDQSYSDYHEALPHRHFNPPVG
jgi:hypothetical protein